MDEWRGEAFTPLFKAANTIVLSRLSYTSYRRWSKRRASGNKLHIPIRLFLTS